MLLIILYIKIAFDMKLYLGMFVNWVIQTSSLHMKMGRRQRWWWWRIT